MIAEDDDTKVPVVAVVGFLPASKEGNLLKHILTGEHGKRVAVVRYADCLGVDGAELERCKCSQCVVDGVDLVETANGCAVACCRRHGDLKCGGGGRATEPWRAGLPPKDSGGEFGPWAPCRSRKHSLW